MRLSKHYQILTQSSSKYYGLEDKRVVELINTLCMLLDTLFKECLTFLVSFYFNGISP